MKKKTIITIILILATILVAGCNPVEKHGFKNIDLKEYERVRWLYGESIKDNLGGYTVNCDPDKCCRYIGHEETPNEIWCYKLNPASNTTRIGEDIRQCERNCIKWFKVFTNNNNSKSCGSNSKQVTDCFKHCYSLQKKEREIR